MAVDKKNSAEILDKLGIKQLNPMQEAASDAIRAASNLLLLSPTGSGKTLAFLLPLIDKLDAEIAGVQAMILVPTRELAIQISDVLREMGSGYKVNVVYGGRSGTRERQELEHEPAIIVGTPGRMADHLRRNAFSPGSIKTLVLDEFDKSLEIGFTEEMREIIRTLKGVRQKVLTSATTGVSIPEFVQLKDLEKLDFLSAGVPQLKIEELISPQKDKRPTLANALVHLSMSNGIVFCNFKDSISELSDFLWKHKIPHGTFHGGMEQVDRERALIKFRNGTYRTLIATDLAARGIDIPELSFIIHYELPSREEEFTHRNGRTARMNNDGTAYVIRYQRDEQKEFARGIAPRRFNGEASMDHSPWSTLFISGGRKDKISKGDIAGLFFKKGNLEKHELGIIELKSDCAFVAVYTSRVEALIPLVNNQRLKKRKVRVSVMD